MTDPTPVVVAAPAAPDDVVTVLRCERCDVTWRSSGRDRCWCCDGPGEPAGRVRVVDD